MSLLSGIAAAIMQPPTKSPSMTEVLQDFQKVRADEIASLATRAGRNGQRVAFAELERDEWRAYARTLEKLCMANGIPLPAAPDEGQEGDGSAI